MGNKAFLKAAGSMIYLFMRQVFNRDAESLQGIVLEEVYAFFESISEDEVGYDAILALAKNEFEEGEHAAETKEETIEMLNLAIDEYMLSETECVDSPLYSFMVCVIDDYFAPQKDLKNNDEIASMIDALSTSALSILIESQWGEDEESAKYFAAIIAKYVDKALWHTLVERELYFNRYTGTMDYEELAWEIMSDDVLDSPENEAYFEELVDAINNKKIEKVLFEQGWRVNKIYGGAIGIDFGALNEIANATREREVV